jgi:hypothetical protein
MSDSSYHIAQLNIGCVRAPVDDPLMAGFTNNLMAINTLGHNTPGFVWQLLTEEGDSTAFRMFADENDLLINMTVWESIKALFDFTYHSPHTDFLRRREWFEPLADLPPLVLWWVPAGHHPTLEEAKAKLLHLNQHGPTPLAFTFRQQYTIEEMTAYLRP